MVCLVVFKGREKVNLAKVKHDNNSKNDHNGRFSKTEERQDVGVSCHFQIKRYRRSERRRAEGENSAAEKKRENIKSDLILIWRNRIPKLDVLIAAVSLRRTDFPPRACQRYYVEHGNNLRSRAKHCELVS